MTGIFSSAKSDADIGQRILSAETQTSAMWVQDRLEDLQYNVDPCQLRANGSDGVNLDYRDILLVARKSIGF